MISHNNLRFLFAMAFVATFGFAFVAPVQASTQCNPAQMAQGTCCDGGAAGHGMAASGVCGVADCTPAIFSTPVIVAGVPLGMTPVRDVAQTADMQWLEISDTPPPRY